MKEEAREEEVNHLKSDVCLMHWQIEYETELISTREELLHFFLEKAIDIVDRCRFYHQRMSKALLMEFNASLFLAQLTKRAEKRIR